MAKPDTRSKALLYLVLKSLGEVETSREIASPPQFADTFFRPDPSLTPDMVAEALRLFVRMAKPAAIFEPFRNSPTHQQCLDIVDKLLTLNRELRPRNVTAAHGYEPPLAWILTNDKPRKALEAMAGEPDVSFGPKGIYRLQQGPGTYIVVLRELPRTRETLILRLLGRSKTLQGALADIDGLEDVQLRGTLREFIESYAMVIERTPSQTRGSDEEEFLIEARRLLQERDDKTRLVQARNGAISVYQARFGETVSADALAQIEALSLDELDAWIPKLATQSLEEIHRGLGLDD